MTQIKTIEELIEVAKVQTKSTGQSSYVSIAKDIYSGRIFSRAWDGKGQVPEIDATGWVDTYGCKCRGIRKLGELEISRGDQYRASQLIDASGAEMCPYLREYSTRLYEYKSE